MRKHGWQLPYHPLQVVAVAVFLALGFAFYVFFAPFVGKQLFQYIAIGLYTPLILCVFGLYIWCAAADPADPGVFKSKKYLKIPDRKKLSQQDESKLGGKSNSSIQAAHAAATIGGKLLDENTKEMDAKTEGCTVEIEKINVSSRPSSSVIPLLAFIPCAFKCNCSSPQEESSDQHLSEDGMFYCSLCEVEVFKYSKHCRVCDKCVDRFDHHCRWLNNCIGKRNYRKFFILMVSALVLLIFQWSAGILVLVCCFLEQKRFSVDITSKLGSSFTLAPFVIVVAVCTILAVIATLPLAQLFFFHILLIKKGISTYDYIIALREQEQQEVGGQQSPQLSHASSLTGLSSASSFNTFHRGTWCTPPRLFLEDQFDVVPPDSASVSSLGKKMAGDEPIKKKNPATVKISPWALARLNAEDVSKAASEARKKSKILQPVVRRGTQLNLDSSGGRHIVPKPDNNNRRRNSKRIRLPAELPPLEPLTKDSDGNDSSLTSLAPLQLEARSAFRTTASSPESSTDSPDRLHPFRVTLGPTEVGRLMGPSAGAVVAARMGTPLSRSASDGYEASGGEDSDRVPSRNVQRSTTNWSNLLLGSERDERVGRLNASTSSSHVNSRNL
ncbi:probable protein S-acyltransferase 22 [Rhododendron vialii]|uniref:probable protein S-acyltransferase 22 n=1 Tax=Rhododendron vialii TaxID=182163 RepID=UPI00265F8182|nr:probable protein S-acyltransferase 22 [Rhododendron vialii]